MQDILDALEAARDERVQALQSFIRIPSVSADPAHDGDMARAANWLVHRFYDAGLERVRLVPTPGHPAVRAQWTHAKGAPTVLVYGHYDVQPAVREDGWTRDPFCGTVEDERVWGRGASDMKGQLACYIDAVAAWLKTRGELPVNIHFLVEGEEEVGSTNFQAVLDRVVDDLRPDLLLVSDSPMRDPDTPTIGYSLRGLVYLEVHVEGPPRDLHSGVFGGIVRNPLDALVALLASLKDPETGRILADGFHTGIRAIDKEELARVEAEGETEELLRKATGVESLWCPEGSPQACLGLRPTLDVHGVWGGYSGPGSKTVIPAEAHAKLSMRLVPHQDPDAVAEAVIEHLRKHAPPGVRAHVDVLHSVEPLRMEPDAAALAPVMEALAETWGRPAVRLPVGGSIGAAAKMWRTLGVKPVLVAFGNRDEGMHGPDEFFRLSSLHRGTEAVARILERVAAAAGPPAQAEGSGRKKTDKRTPETASA